MKSIVMIAYVFPPEGSAGTFRPLRFVRHLPSRGWQPTVITRETRSYERYDPSLLAQLPENLRIIRVPNVDPWFRFQETRRVCTEKRMPESSAEKAKKIRLAEQAGWRRFAGQFVRNVEAWCYHPDVAMGWIRPAVKAIVQYCAKQKSDVLWATGGPWSSFIVAERASRQTGVPYVLDFRDAWTLVREPFANKRPHWAVRSDRRTLYRLLKGAQAVVLRYKTEAECYWRAYPDAVDAERIHIIPNGFDGTVERYREIERDRCEILYSGTLASYRYDSLVEALSRLKRTDPRLTEKLRLVFVGEHSEQFLAQAESHELRDLVTVSPPLPHAQIIKMQQNSHALLMLEREPIIRGYELLAGAKLFGYLQAGRPIIGVLPDGEAKKVLRTVGVSTIADNCSTDEIVNVFKQVLDAWSEGRLASLVPDPAACAAFSAENQTSALIRALERRPPIDRFIPGLATVPPSLCEEIENGNWTKSVCGVASPN
jgi:glycosyltransferase involved in cell wall biosynthesis